MPQFVDIGGSTRFRIPEGDEIPTDSHDAFPAIIEDSRHFWAFLGHDVATVEDVYRLEEGWCAGDNPPHARTPPNWPTYRPMKDPEGRSVIPRIDASRWIADCPACGTASAVWDRNPRMTCLGRGCGLIFKVMWQLPAVRAEVIRVIADWPTVNRSWDAHKGETVEELKIQAVLMQGVAPDLRNGLLVAHGVKMPDELTSPGEYLDRLRTKRIKAAL